MSGDTTKVEKRRRRTATASHTVCFRKKTRRPPDQPHEEATTGRIPRITRLLALAHKIDGMIRVGEIRDWAEAVRIVGVTRARMTQIANLLLLEPEIQEAILHLPPVLEGDPLITERDLRSMTAQIEWSAQATVWTALGERTKSPSAAGAGFAGAAAFS